jgi:hypothetical protein
MGDRGETRLVFVVTGAHPVSEMDAAAAALRRLRRAF